MRPGRREHVIHNFLSSFLSCVSFYTNSNAARVNKKKIFVIIPPLKLNDTQNGPKISKPTKTVIWALQN